MHVSEENMTEASCTIDKEVESVGGEHQKSCPEALATTLKSPRYFSCAQLYDFAWLFGQILSPKSKSKHS